MAEQQVQIPRQWHERVIEGFDRSRIRQEAMKVRRKRFAGLRKRYGTMLLGASLAVGGIGIPMSANRQAPSPGADLPSAERSAEGGGAFQQVARSLAFGVDEAIPIGRSVEDSLVMSEQEMDIVTEKAREDFFKSEVPFGSIIYKEAKKNDLSPELVAAVVQTESNFKPTARSGVGAQGLMQLMPKTGRWMGGTNLTNPADNVRAGAKYLRYLNERFDGDETKVLAAYNAGEGNVRRYGGVPPFRETRNYVMKVTTAQRDFEQKVTGHVTDTLESGSDVFAEVGASVAVSR
ncbi:MAG TPA: lytic transglycosylase domain-containing protein [Thermoanaerobaculia bacterium]|nr:lytic transglycosylase domain-containing protein [Thermoanaerobaculia bacterium]